MARMRSATAVKAGSGYPWRRVPGRGGENCLASQTELGDAPMRRTFLILSAVAACAMLALAASASAKTTPAKTCTASSPNVIGHQVKGTRTSSNVDPSQARFATCAQAKQVMVKTTELRIEMPRSTKAFYCVPTVKSTEPDVVAYKCIFKGADTATFIKLTFQVKYDQD
jgi:hypothetical protein